MAIGTEAVIVNIGPHHPSSHGLFRLKATLDGEVVTDIELVLGYLHRGVEKLAEARTYSQIIPLTDRLDYLSSMTNNFAYVVAVEKLAGIKVPLRADYIRVIVAEMMRISSHLSATGFLLNELGAYFTPVMYMFREREKLLDFFDMICGQRLTYNYLRIGGVSHDLPEEFSPAITRFLDEMPRFIDEYENLITGNEIFLARTKGIGILSREKAINASASGPVLRASGVKRDLRKDDPYSVYNKLDFDVPTGSTGDVFDRYQVRIREMRESVKLIRQALGDMPPGIIKTEVPTLLRPPKGEAYGCIEAPKGELGFYLVSDGSIAPFRCHIRAPSYINLTTLKEIIIGWKLADAIVIFGSLDTVLGEVDR